MFSRSVRRALSRPSLARPLVNTAIWQRQTKAVMTPAHMAMASRAFSDLHVAEVEKIVRDRREATRREIGILVETFLRYDEGRTGALSQDSISKLFDDAGMESQGIDYQQLFSTLDENQDNEIQLEEFLDRLPRGARVQIIKKMSGEDRPSSDSYRDVRVTVPRDQAKIVYTFTDEAPMLATQSLLPIVQGFCKSSQVQVELKDISVAGRIIAAFPERLSEAQRQPDELAELGSLCKSPAANVIKLPNVSASGPQLVDAIVELQSHGYNLPDYPTNPSTPEEHEIQARYAKVLGSAVNPVLREGNSDRRVAAPVKAYAQANPHRQKDWDANSKTYVRHMCDGDFFSTEQSTSIDQATSVRIELVHAPGRKAHDDGVTTTVLKARSPLMAKEVVDSAVMRVSALREYFAASFAACKEEGVLLSLHLKATMMKVSDPIMFGHAVTVFFKSAFEKNAELFAQLKVNPNNGIEDVLIKIAELPEAQRAAVEADLKECYEQGPNLAMVDSRKGITNLHVPNNVIIDASMPPAIRDGGKMWNANDELEETMMLIPDRCYAGIYQAMVEDCQKHGKYDVSTIGNVCNVGLMAQKAEEYGSHPCTFEIPCDGLVHVVDDVTGTILFEHQVSKGDIWRMCQTKDTPIQDWVKLAVSRARASNSPAYFWLNTERAHDRSLIQLVEKYLQDHDTQGLDIQILAPEDAMRKTLERFRAGQDTISVTGNVLRDYLTDLFPIIELGTSAKMLSIVPLLAGGGLFETGAGGSAPKHVQQLVEEGHLRWDSLGEFLALAVSLEDLGAKTESSQPKILADALNTATGKLLSSGKSPSRKVNELDNRGSHFYIAMYWAEALANQTECPDLAKHFAPIAQQLQAKEEQILTELNAAQGAAVDIGGYYHPDLAKMQAAMRPSPALNAIIDSM